MLATLRHRNFALLWFGGLISVIGDWVLMTALPYYVYEQTHSTLTTATMVAAELLPQLFLGTIAGVFVDRWDRRRVLIVANALQAGMVLLLLLVASLEQLWIVYLITFAQSCAIAFFGPAENALLPTLVSEEHLVSANSLNSLNNNLGRLIGPPLGGALLVFVGLQGVVLIDSASFMIATVLIALVSIGARSRQAPQTQAQVVGGVKGAWTRLWQEWIDGLRFVWRTRVVAILFTVLVLISFGGVMYDPLGPAFAVDILHIGPDTLGWLLTVQAIGGIVSGLAIGRFGNRVEPAKLLGWSCVITALLLFVKFNVPYLPLTFLMVFSVGLTAVATGVAAQTLAQRSVPDEYMGRAFGALGTTTAILSLFSVLGLAGALGELVGLLPMLNLATGITLAAGLLGIVLLTPLRAARAARTRAVPSPE